MKHPIPAICLALLLSASSVFAQGADREPAPVKLGPWQTHFFKGGTTHAITNPNSRVVQFLEFFSKKDGGAASIEDAQALALAFARSVASEQGVKE